MESDARWVSTLNARCEILEPGYDLLVRHFRPLVNATSAAVETNVICALTLRITRLAIACHVLAQKGLDEEGLLPQRSATEALINLCYIFHTGPRSKGEAKDTRGLCLQFAAYADLAYWKMIKDDQAHAKGVFKTRRGLSEAECDRLLAENESLARAAEAVHGCKKDRWHAVNAKDMAKMVLGDPPGFLEVRLIEHVFKMFVSSNSAVHADALSMRSQYKDHGSDLLALVLKSDVARGDIVASLALEAWKAMGDYFGQVDWVNEMTNAELKRVLKGRYDSSPPVSSRIVLPGWIGT